MSDLITMLSAASGAGGAEETDPNFNQTTLLLHGDGTNGAQNNTFLDSSSNTFTITRNGNTTQGTFSPFSLAEGEWSNYFDGSGDYLSISSNSAFEFGTGDFTVECWVNSTNKTALNTIAFNYNSPTNYNGWMLLTDSGGNGYAAAYVYGGSSPQETGIVGTSNVCDGAWHHIALVRTGTTLSLFVDGTRQATTTNSYNITSTALFRIGSAENSRYWNGYITNLRIVKGSGPYAAGSSTLTVPTAPLTAIANTSLLTCQSNRFVDNSTNAFAITVNGNTSVQPFSPFAPSAVYSPSVNGGSGYFDGTGDYLTNTSNDMKTAMNFGTGDFTVEAWVYFTSSGNNQGIIDSATGLSTSALGQWFLYRDGSSKLQFGVHVGGAIATSTATLPVNTWTHVAASRSGTSVKLFINGVEDGSATNSTNFNAAGSVQIGVVTTPIYLTGYVSNVRVVKGRAVYTSAFTPPTAPLGATSGGTNPPQGTETSLLLNFTNAGIFDNTGKNNLETVGNAQIDTTTKKYGTGSMEFDGTGDYLFALNSQPLGSGDFTIEGWVNFDGLVEDALVSTRDAIGASSTGMLITAYSSLLQVFTAGAFQLTSTTTLSTGTWYHVAVVKSSGTTTLYLDGIAEDTYADSNNYTSSRVYVGGDVGGSFFLDGYVDDLRITKGVARYTAAFTPPTAAFPDL